MKTKNDYAYILKWYKKIKFINVLGGKCIECGESRPWLINFHHINPEEKEIKISKIKDYSWKNIENEVLKCELLCYNCHRKRHSLDENTISYQSKKVILELKLIDGCENCKYNDYIGSLDFHHINSNDKNYRISQIRFIETSCEEMRNKIINEINKCIVLCANCHYDLHFDKNKFNLFEQDIQNWNYKEYKPPIDKEIVIKYYNEGMLQTNIAKIMGRNTSTICGIIKRYKGKLGEMD
jgi:hypothetical protein